VLGDYDIITSRNRWFAAQQREAMLSQIPLGFVAELTRTLTLEAIQTAELIHLADTKSTATGAAPIGPADTSRISMA